LAQSKFVKSGEVDALFASKRQMPISYLGYMWDGSDNATTAMSDEIAAVSGTDAINSAVGSLTASTQQAFNDITTDINASFASLTDQVKSGTNAALVASKDSTNAALVDTVESVNAATGTYAGQLADANHTGVLLQGLNATASPGVAPYSHTDAINTIVQRITDGATPIYTTAPITYPHPGMGDAAPGTVSAGSISPSAPSFGPPSVAAQPATGPDITWPPLDGPPVTMTYVQFTTLLGMLTGRRRTLQIQRTNHKNNIAGLTTVPAVAAYDITTGW
jgi:hypothetical protein